VMQHLKGLQKFKFLLAFLKAKSNAKSIDLSAVKSKGLSNQSFLNTQIEYICLFTALSQILGTSQAIHVCKKIMDETAKEALLLCLPEMEKMKQFANSFEVNREYAKAMTEASKKSGCME